MAVHTGRRLRCWSLLLACCLTAGGCFRIKPSRGGGQDVESSARRIDATDVAVERGYAIELVRAGFTFPTQVAFDDKGGIYVVESGYSYGEVFTKPQLLRLEPGGAVHVVATGEHGPWTGAVFHRGSFYVAEGAGRILRVGLDGSQNALVEGLPSMGDHHTNGPALGPDGKLYFGQGVMTNAGVVGEDNQAMGWLARKPELHDVPCRDVVLRGRNYKSKNPLTELPDDEVSTGAFVPFGTQTGAGQIVTGSLPCSGAVMKIAPEGGALELVAWGFRNPYGLAFGPDGQLYLTDNGYDERGSRPVFGAPDLLWKVEPGRWYGWPDYVGGRAVADEDFQSKGKEMPQAVLQSYPETPPQPIARLAVHSSSNGFDISRSAAFGHVGEAFIAQFGDMAPAVGKVWGPVGYKVVRVELERGLIRDFAVNRGDKNAPASALGRGGLERPVAVRFDPSGEVLYVVDFGILRMHDDAPQPVPNSGALWRVRSARNGG
jgi:glucose/arabinose dehydrogenase